jgi:hypothetical protein
MVKLLGVVWQGGDFAARLRSPPGCAAPVGALDALPASVRVLLAPLADLLHRCTPAEVRRSRGGALAAAPALCNVVPPGVAAEVRAAMVAAPGGGEEDGVGVGVGGGGGGGQEWSPDAVWLPPLLEHLRGAGLCVCVCGRAL